MPILSGELIDSFFHEATGGEGAMFNQHERGVGFPFMLLREEMPVVEKQITKGEFSLQRLAKRLKARSWQPPARRVEELFNINTHADLAEAERRWKEAERCTATLPRRPCSPCFFW